MFVRYDAFLKQHITTIPNFFDGECERERARERERELHHIDIA
jgi:hypothetical protein